MFLTPYPTRKTRKSRHNGFVKPLQVLERSALPIQQTLRTAKLFTEIEQNLKNFLHQGISPHCHILKLDNEQLDLAVPNAALASKLRQFVPSIVSHLSQHGYAITKVHIKVRASLQKTPSTQNLTTAKKSSLAQCHQAYQTLLEQYPDGPLAATLRKILEKNTD